MYFSSLCFNIYIVNFTNSANILAAVKITVKLLHFFHPKDNQIREPIIILEDKCFYALWVL